MACEATLGEAFSRGAGCGDFIYFLVLAFSFLVGGGGSWLSEAHGTMVQKSQQRVWLGRFFLGHALLRAMTMLCF